MRGFDECGDKVSLWCFSVKMPTTVDLIEQQPASHAMSIHAFIFNPSMQPYKRHLKQGSLWQEDNGGGGEVRQDGRRRSRGGAT